MDQAAIGSTSEAKSWPLRHHHLGNTLHLTNQRGKLVGHVWNKT